MLLRSVYTLALAHLFGCMPNQQWIMVHNTKHSSIMQWIPICERVYIMIFFNVLLFHEVIDYYLLYIVLIFPIYDRFNSPYPYEHQSKWSYSYNYCEVLIKKCQALFNEILVWFSKRCVTIFGFIRHPVWAAARIQKQRQVVHINILYVLCNALFNFSSQNMISAIHVYIIVVMRKRAWRCWRGVCECEHCGHMRVAPLHMHASPGIIIIIIIQIIIIIVTISMLSYKFLFDIIFNFKYYSLWFSGAFNILSWRVGHTEEPYHYYSFISIWSMDTYPFSTHFYVHAYYYL